jgi:hypothetical protein
MKPTFALTFPDDAVALLHRTARGWMEVGSVSLDRADFDAGLAMLRSTALGLEAGGITTKIVLPNSQIRYMTLPAPGPDPAARRAQIRQALEGQTPYAVDDLAFDWSGKGPMVQVAVVARETLAEAETFAAAHRLNPLSFVANPEPGSFAGEPWFGPTALSETLLSPDETVERDPDRVQVVGNPPRLDPAEQVAERPVSPPEPPMPVATGPDKPDKPDKARPRGPEVTVAEIPEPLEPPEPAARAPRITPSLSTAESGAIRVVTDPRLAKKQPPRGAAKAPPPNTPDAPRPASPPRLSAVPGGAARGTKLAEADWPLERVTAAARAKEDQPRPPAPVVTAPGIAMPRDRKLSVVPKPDTRAQADGKAGADKPRPTPNSAAARGKPRHLGLILTVILLIVLAAVAFWSSFLVTSVFDNSDDPVVAATVETPAPEQVAVAPPAPVAETPAAVQAPAPAATEPTGTPALERATVAQPETGGAVNRNPGAEPQDEILLALVDPAITTPDAVALVMPAPAGDRLPALQPAPPPFGTRYEIDSAGRIVPTAEGILTPEGVLLVAGRPGLVPPPRPAALAPAPAAVVPGAEVLDEVPFADPDLAGARPRLRPADLVPPAPDDSAAATPDPGNTRLSSLVPRPRPASVLAAAEAAQAAEAAAVQAAGASLAAGGADQGGASALAVAVSRKPAERPARAGPAVESAVSLAAAGASLVPEDGGLAAAPVAEKQPGRLTLALDDPEAVEVDEPELASAAPSIPTRSSVARQATVRNSINLSKVNLIGVFGTSSNRYAMVRQPNGRMVRVEVGDTVDGGRVAAISDRELRYVKNGDTVTLSMPQG